MPWAGSASKTKQSTIPTPIRRGIRRSLRRISPCSQRSRSCLLQTGERRVARGKLNRLCFETPSAGFDRPFFQIATIHDLGIAIRGHCGCPPQAFRSRFAHETRTFGGGRARHHNHRLSLGCRRRADQCVNGCRENRRLEASFRRKNSRWLAQFQT